MSVRNERELEQLRKNESIQGIDVKGKYELCPFCNFEVVFKNNICSMCNMVVEE